MNQTRIDGAVSRATGDDYDFIRRRGFSLVLEESPLNDDDLQALIDDWDRVTSEQATLKSRGSIPVGSVVGHTASRRLRAKSVKHRRSLRFQKTC